MSYRFAIVGCGRIAHRHAEQILRHGALQAVCDNIPSKATDFANLFNATPYFSIEEMLHSENLDVVSVCTPNGLHKHHSILSLQSGHHVLCEKPMAISVSDGQFMIAAAKKSGKRLFVVKQNRYNAPVIAVKRLLEENKLGRIFSFQLNCFWNRPSEYYKDNWHGSKDLDGGTLYTQFSHFIDLLYWFLGDVKKVQGMRYNYTHQQDIDFEDTGVVCIEMKNGSMGTLNYTVNSFKRNMEGSFALFGEKGTVKIGGEYLNEIAFFSVEGEQEPVIRTGKLPNKYGFYEGSMSNHDIVYTNLIRALEDPNHDILEAGEALKTIEVIELIYRETPLQL